MNFYPVYMKRKVPFLFFTQTKLSKPVKANLKTRKLFKENRLQKFQYLNKPRGILKNGETRQADYPIRFVRQHLRIGYVQFYNNNANPNRVDYMLAARKRAARRDVQNLARNRAVRRAERAACVAKGFHCDESGNAYPYMTDTRTFINSAQNAVLMQGYTAARIARFKALKIVIAPRSGIRRAARLAARLAATL